MGDPVKLFSWLEFFSASFYFCNMKWSILVLAVCFIRCGAANQPVPELKGSYHGYWENTSWDWNFGGNRFQLLSKGGVMPKEARGNFTQRNDSLFLHFLQDDIRPLGIGINRTDTLVLINDRCLMSLIDGYDYCSQNPNNPAETHVSKKRR